jgi:coenzyme F420-dependent glucose-6-phosphate dehydrogenase
MFQIGYALSSEEHSPNDLIQYARWAEETGFAFALWQGETLTHRGVYYTVENARIYTLPDHLPPILVAASGPQAAEVAGRIGDGLITTAPETELLKRFEAEGGAGKPRYGQLTVCWASDEATAQRIAYEYWPTAAVRGELSQQLPTPAHFEQAAKMVRQEDVAQAVICGPDPGRHIAGVVMVLLSQPPPPN